MKRLSDTPVLGVCLCRLALGHYEQADHVAQVHVVGLYDTDGLSGV